MWPKLLAQFARKAKLVEVGRGPVGIELRQEELSLIGWEIPSAGCDSIVQAGRIACRESRNDAEGPVG